MDEADEDGSFGATSNRRMNEAPRRSEVTGALARGIAHDLNNILAVIVGHGEIALEDAPTESRLRRGIESILIAAERGRQLVEGIPATGPSEVTESSEVAATPALTARESGDRSRR